MPIRLALLALLAAALPVSAQPVCCPDDDDRGHALIRIWRELTQDRATAPRRVKAIRALAETDCRRWPEAETVLIATLRCDRNECVRYEAALALAKGCCCTPAVTLALSHVVSCSSLDGAPVETSGRIRAVAATALERCLASRCCVQELPAVLPYSPPPPRTDTLPSELPTAFRSGPFDYYAKARWVSPAAIEASGRWSLAAGQRIGYDSPAPSTADAESAYTGRSSVSQARTPSSLWETLTGPKPPAEKVEFRVGVLKPPVVVRPPTLAVQQAAYTEPVVQPPVVQPPVAYVSAPPRRSMTGVMPEPMAIARSTLYQPAPAGGPYRYR